VNGSRQHAPAALERYPFTQFVHIHASPTVLAARLDHAIDLYRLKGGKISQEWASEDLTAILNDTGTYKAPWIP